ncbi:GTP pyrophosphokinase family protein [Mucilaginibacter sp. RCC_168]|uniref:GTP pyrophosphokinase n=1 Tax=Mucilaginibacter sp. RCC_168 TaxID=3239221 RepID=UPI003525C6FC
MKEEILENFRNNKKTFNAFKDRLIYLVRDLIEKENIIPHQIIGRTKDISSLSKKIDKKGDKYNHLSDITDVIGLRVITYLESDVDPIAQIIEKEFEKDEENSIDKRILKNDQFGYRSLHVVVSLNDKRIKLPEYSKYKSIKCEIQIRSILQHAWAEIEHDLGYKGIDVPDNYKRSFNRVAALLETADLEFVKLKSQLTNYEKDVPELIENKPEEVDINKASISSFIQKSLIIAEIKKTITEATGHGLRLASNYNLVIAILKYFDIGTIKALKTILEENKIQYFEFLKHYIDVRDFKRVLSENVVLTYFGNYLALSKNDPGELERYLQSFGPDKVDELTQDLLKAYRESKGY